MNCRHDEAVGGRGDRAFEGCQKGGGGPKGGSPGSHEIVGGVEATRVQEDIPANGVPSLQVMEEIS